MHYYTFNIGDYASHTKGLSLLEDLAYRRLLDEYYLNERPFNGCSTDVARSVGMREHVQEVEYILNKFFTKNDDGEWLNKRAQEEIDAFKAKRQQQSNAGKLSAARRLNKRSTDVKRTLSECSTDVQPTINQEPKNHIKEKIDKKESSELSTQAAKATQQKRGTRLQNDWQPSEQDIMFCKTKRPDLNVSEVVDQFCDYWVAQTGAKATKLDWSATWRNWVRNQKATNHRDGRTEHQRRTDATTRALYNLDDLNNLDSLRTIEGGEYAAKRLG